MAYRARGNELQSRAAIRGHPIHPMLVAFPVAFLIGALATDFAYASTRDPFWAYASYWLVFAGLVTGGIAAAFGLVDFLALRRVRELRAAWVHFFGNAMALILSLISVLFRAADPVAAVLPQGLTLSVLVAAILGVTGWYGGELTFRHHVGMVHGEAAERHAEIRTPGHRAGHRV